MPLSKPLIPPKLADHVIYDQLKGPGSYKKLAWKAYTSYGVFIQMLPFLSQLEQIELQRSNQFFYNIAIGRV